MTTVIPSTDPTPSAGPGWRVAIPAAFTLGSLTCAAAAAFSLVTMGWDPAKGAVAHPDHLLTTAWLILLAVVFDILDGFMARLFKAASPFGAQLDSLADAMSFGAAPALLVAAAGRGAIGTTLAALLVFWTATIRVARYNAEKTSVGPALHFKGLITPGAGGALATWILLAHFVAGPSLLLGGLAPEVRAAIAAAMQGWLPLYAVLLSGLMLSDRRYVDLPKHYYRGLWPWYHLVGALVLGLAFGPEPVLAIAFLAYALSGLLGGRFDTARDAVTFS
ncbi:MAG TPA: CDP-alcohol phosphatidyltransferase family protein [Stenomitos sp.]